MARIVSKKRANVLIHLTMIAFTTLVWGSVAAGVGFMGAGILIWLLNLAR